MARAVKSPKKASSTEKEVDPKSVFPFGWKVDGDRVSVPTAGLSIGRIQSVSDDHLAEAILLDKAGHGRLLSVDQLCELLAEQAKNGDQNDAPEESTKKKKATKPKKGTRRWRDDDDDDDDYIDGDVTDFVTNRLRDLSPEQRAACRPVLLTPSHFSFTTLKEYYSEYHHGKFPFRVMGRPMIGSKVRAITYAQLVSAFSYNDDESYPLYDYLAWNTDPLKDKQRWIVIFNLLVEGAHFGDRLAQVDCRRVGQLDVLCMKVGKKRVLLPGALPVTDDQLDVAKHTAYAVTSAFTSDSDFLDVWVDNATKTLANELHQKEIEYNDANQALQKAVTELSHLRAIKSMVDSGSSALIQTMIDGFLKAGFVSHRFTSFSIIFVTDDIYISLGSNQTEDRKGYIGRFEVAVGLNNDVVIRNVASPVKYKQLVLVHPILARDRCLGGYKDILKNCFLNRDWHNLALAILAMLSHFDNDYSRSLKDRLPTSRPDVVHKSKSVVLFGDQDRALPIADAESFDAAMLRPQDLRDDFGDEDEDDDDDFGDDEEVDAGW